MVIPSSTSPSLNSFAESASVPLPQPPSHLHYPRSLYHTALPYPSPSKGAGAASAGGGSLLNTLLAQDQHLQSTGNSSFAYKAQSRSEVRRRAQAEAAALSGGGATPVSGLASPTGLASPIPAAAAASAAAAGAAAGGALPWEAAGVVFAMPVGLVSYDSLGAASSLGTRNLVIVSDGDASGNGAAVSLLVYDQETQRQDLAVPLAPSFTPAPQVRHHEMSRAYDNRLK